MNSNFQFRSEIVSGFEASAELGPVDRRRLEEPSFTAE
jgi:hypothetical protein